MNNPAEQLKTITVNATLNFITDWIRVTVVEANNPSNILWQQWFDLSKAPNEIVKRKWWVRLFFQPDPPIKTIFFEVKNLKPDMYFIRYYAATNWSAEGNLIAEYMVETVVK